MRTGAFVLAGALSWVGCSSAPPEGATVREPTAVEPNRLRDPETEVRDLLHRTYRLARAEARPDRDSLVGLLGLDPLAPREAPWVRVLAKDEAPTDLRVETLEFLSEAGVPVPATLWLPAATPAPAVVVTHGHLEAGRSAPAVRQRCAALARAGVAALSVDLFGQGERAALGHRESWALAAAGDSVLALDVRAIVRALDLLAARPDIEASSLGLLGQSGGAIAVVHAAAIDPRARATFCSSGLHDWEQAVLTVPQCTCNYAPGQLRAGTVADAAALIPPRRLAVSVGSEDPHVPPRSALAAFERAVGAAQRVGEPEAVSRQLREGEGHAFTPAAREAAVGFFVQTLGLGAAAEASGPEAPLPAWRPAWPEGPPASALDLAELGAREQRALLPERPLPAEAALPRLRELLALAEPAGLARELEGRLSLETEPGFHLRGWTRRAAEPVRAWVLVADSRGGRAALEAETTPKDAHVLTVDLRGQGDSAGGAWDYLQLVVGAAADRPLLGRRVHDLRGWLDTLRGLAAGAPMRLRADGEAAFAALLLAALEPARFEGVRVELGDLPAKLVADAGEESRWGLPQSLAVAGLARLGDVSDFAGWIPPELRDRIRVESFRARDGRRLEPTEPQARALLARLHPSATSSGEDPALD